jgi:hypothetical protein
MVRLAEVPDGMAPDAAIAARGAHRWHFSAAEAAHLRAALRNMSWGRSGTEWTLPYGDFMGLVYALRPPDPAVAPEFHSGIADTELIHSSWVEVCKGMAPSDWLPCSYGVMKHRLSEAAYSPAVDPAELVIWSAAGTPLVAAAAATEPSVAGEGAPYARPGWVTRLRLVDGELAEGASLAPASDYEYYTVTRMNAAYTRTGSPFEAYFTELARAAAARTPMADRSEAVKAALIVRHGRASAWPPKLFVYTPPGVARELDLADRHAYHSCGGLGAVAQAIVLDRLEPLLLACPPISAVLLHVTSRATRESMVRRLQAMVNMSEPNVILLDSVEETARRLAPISTSISNAEAAAMPAEERMAHVQTLVLRMHTLTPGSATAAAVSSSSDAAGGAPKGIASRLHPARLHETIHSAAYIDTFRDAKAHALAEQPSQALRIYFCSLAAPRAPCTSAWRAGTSRRKWPTSRW